MPPQLSPSEQLTYATIRIKCETTTGISTGTGFFYRFVDGGDTHIPVIVSNKHVVEGARRGQILFHTCDTQGNILEGEHFKYTVDNFSNSWIPHPDAGVDLCSSDCSIAPGCRIPR